MQEMLKSKSVDLWIKKACGSPKTRYIYLHRFSKFSKYFNLDPDVLIEQWKTVRYDWKERERFIDTWTENIENYVYTLFSEYAPLSRTTEMSAIASFFQHNRIPIEVKKEKHIYVKYHNRDITRDEIKRIFEHIGLRERTFFIMMAESGLRPNTLVQLRYRHIKKDFEADKVPMKIDVPAEIVKDRVGNRFSFIGEDGFRTLKEYLSPSPQLKDDDLIFRRQRFRKEKPFISPETFSNFFNKTITSLGLDTPIEQGKPKSLRLYCLRKYFRNNIRVDMSFREFWMGHTFGTDEHYLTRDVEKHREAYTEAYPSIRIFQPAANLQELREELQEQVKKTVKEEVRKLYHETIEPAESQNRYITEDFIQTNLHVKPEKVSYRVVTQNGRKVIYIWGYYKDGKYVKLQNPAKIIM